LARVRKIEKSDIIGSSARCKNFYKLQAIKLMKDENLSNINKLTNKLFFPFNKILN